MNKFTLSVFPILLIISSCKKIASASGQIHASQISVSGAMVISRGHLSSTQFPGLNGEVKIYLQTNGRYVLGLEQMTVTTNSDLSAYFSPTAGFSSAAIKLFSFKRVDGELYYELPLQININDFRFLLVQSDLSQTPVGFAELK